MTAKQIIDVYISFFEKRGHKRIPGAPLVPFNDPTTLFTSSGMQPLVPYLLGEPHPSGTRLVDVQNSFRAVDIEEVGDNRHETFFRMLGNWSLGDYFKKEQIPWMWELYTKEFGLDPKKLYITVFEGYKEIGKDETAFGLWKDIFEKEGLDPKERIFEYGVEKNWWSRSGTPDNMPTGEPGGPDTEMFYDFGEDLGLHEKSQWSKEKCHPNCDCGRFLEIGNSVFMQYIKQADGSFQSLPKQNVDFGGGLERILMAINNTSDVFKTTLFAPIIQTLEQATNSVYGDHKRNMRIIADHLAASMLMVAEGVRPSNKEQGYILRRLLRRGLDNLLDLKENAEIKPVLEIIAEQYQDTDPILVEKFEEIQLSILEEIQKYERTRTEAKKFIQKKYKQIGDELMGITEISADDAFVLYTTHGLSPTQIKSLGYTFNDQKFAEKMEEHQKLSRTASSGKFKGGLADAEENTIKGHTATHLLQQALRDMLGTEVHQTGSNITTERLRFDFNFDKKLTDEQIKGIEQVVREKIKEDLPVHFEMLPLQKAKEINALGLFDAKYQETVKVYIIGGTGKDGDYDAYSKEFCGGPHVPHTGVIKSFTITKQESLGQGQQRIYATVS